MIPDHSGNSIPIHELSEQFKPTLEKVKKMIAEEINPVTEEYYGTANTDVDDVDRALSQKIAEEIQAVQAYTRALHSSG